MKKLIIMILSIISLLILSINAFAKDEFIPEYDSNDYSNVNKLTPNKAFNFIEIIDNHEADLLISSYNLAFKNNSYVNINMTTNMILYNEYGDILDKLEFRIYFLSTTSYRLKEIKIVIDGINYISLKYQDNKFDHEQKYYLDIKEINENASLAIIEDAEFKAFYTPIIFDISIIKAFIYEYMDDYEINIDNDLDIDEDDIKKGIGLFDKNNYYMTEISVIESDFKPFIIGTYHIKVRGFNKDKKIIIKNIIINVIDLDSKITINDLNVSYNDYLSKEDIIDNLKINDDYLNISIKSDYYINYDVLGNYKYYVLINFDNSNVLTMGYINVLDNDKPYPLNDIKVIKVKNDNYLEKKDIIDYLKINDDYDGLIDENNIVLEGYYDYLIGYSVPNEFDLTLKAYDSSLNELNYEFKIITSNDIEREAIFERKIDKYDGKIKEKKVEIIEEEINEIENDPVISNSDFVIEAYTNQKLTSSDIQEILISEGYLNNDDIVLLESDYFRLNEIKTGSYPLSVLYDNGDITYYEINILENEISIDDNKNNTNLIVFIIIGSISFIAIVIIVIMRVYIYGKKN